MPYLLRTLQQTRIHRSYFVFCFEFVHNSHPPDSSSSMEVRKDDFRVHLITGTFFVCIVAGGTCLCLYIFLPGAQHTSWYPIVGFILVGIPWLFWLLTYCYRCFKTGFQHIQEERKFAKGFNHVAPNAASSSPATTTAQTESQANSSGSERRVHFGAVIVVGEDGDISHGEADDNADSREP